MLDSWTAIRWGDDNLTWVVHYPDEFVDLWVKSEADRQRMNAEQEAAYRKSFTEELRTGASTTILLSVHAFGQNPVNISPLSKNITLIDPSGKRVSPIAFEKKLDSPMNGLVQGLVFFPRQESENFSIAVKSLARDRETLFAFGGQTIDTSPLATAPGVDTPQAQSQPAETVVKIPTPPKPVKPPTPPDKPEAPTSDEPAFSAGGEIFPPTRPPLPPDDAGTPEETQPAPTPQTSAASSASLGSRQVLEIYLNAWIAGDTDVMYTLLSAESQTKLSKELFARDMMSDSFRRALKEGYKTDWSGETAKVTVAKRILFMKTLDSRQIKFVKEGESARVSW
ncbi:MAG: hypothetical protein LBT31_00120 [Synergistaceae bacterium]|nr:hypothetical protein [Synergistaceae bacterium]